jgi:hypothetical protein
MSGVWESGSTSCRRPTRTLSSSGFPSTGSVGLGLPSPELGVGPAGGGCLSRASERGQRSVKCCLLGLGRLH